VIFTACVYAFIAYLAVQVFYDWELDRKGLHRGGFHPERVVQNTFEIHLFSFLVWLLIAIVSAFLIERFQRALTLALTSAQRRSDELSLVSEIGAAMSQPLPPVEIAANFLHRIQWALPEGAIAVVVSFADDHHTAAILSATGYGPTRRPVIAEVAPGSPDLLETPTAFVVAGTGADPIRASLFRRRFPSANPDAAFAVVPLFSRDRALGAIVLWSGATDAMDHERLALLTSLGRYLAGALDSANLVSRAEARAERETGINRLAQRMRATLEPEEIVSALTDETGRLLDLRHVRVWQADEETELTLAGSWSRPDAKPQTDHAPSNVLRAARDLRTVRDSSSRGTTLSVPVAAAGVLFGVLELIWPSGAANVGDDEITSAEAIARELALGIATAQAFDRQRAAVIELERLNQAKSDFVSMVAHEFRTPLTGIQGFSEIIRDYELATDEIKEYAGDIYADARRLNRMINAQLDLDRLRSGRIELQLEPVDLNRLVADVIDVARPVSPDHHIEFTPDESLSVIQADPDRLIQVLTNLLNNGVKYSPPNSTVSISTVAGEKEVRVVVRDEGVGIPDEYFDRIFEPYARVESPHGRTVSGTGLGLPIVRQIVEMHGGSVWVESEVGHGSTFIVSLPIDASFVAIVLQESPSGNYRSV
jgi:signal transduction histidine kinase